MRKVRDLDAIDINPNTGSIYLSGFNDAGHSVLTVVSADGSSPRHCGT